MTWVRKVDEKFKAYQSDIEEVVVIPDVREGGGDVGVEVVPAETKLFRCHVAGRGEP